MTLSIANLLEPRLRRWTVEEYYRMGDQGFFSGQRVQLIEGRIFYMAPQREAHATAIMLANDAITRAFGKGYMSRTQLPLRISDKSEPEPVVVGGIRDFLKTHPKAALLVIEISDTTLEFDRLTKGRLYANAKIEDYWIVNLADRQLEVYRHPHSPRGARRTMQYDAPIIFGINQSIAPLARPGVSISVKDLLP